MRHRLPKRRGEARGASLRSAPLRFAEKRVDLARFAPLRFALLRSPLLRSGMMRSGMIRRSSSRHAFQALTPFLSWAMWSGLAMRAKPFGSMALSSGRQLWDQTVEAMKRG